MKRTPQEVVETIDLITDLLRRWEVDTSILIMGRSQFKSEYWRSVSKATFKDVPVAEIKPSQAWFVPDNLKRLAQTIRCNEFGRLEIWSQEDQHPLMGNAEEHEDIHIFQYGQELFVLNGHHRVMLAKLVGQEWIDAWVTIADKEIEHT